jgi:hypothetical protein
LSIGGNDSGQHHANPHGPLGWFLAKANARSGTTAAFQNFMRTRQPRTRCQLSMRGQPTTLTSASTGTGTADPDAEQACWDRLTAALTAAEAGNTSAAGTMLPAEIAAAEWHHNGHHIRIRQPGTASRAVRCARRGLKALTPLPLLGALSQPLAGGATAAGILLAPIPLTTPHDPPPYSMPLPGRTLHGEIDRPAPGAMAGAHPVTPAVGPGAPLLPALPTPKPLILTPSDSAERDAAPTPVYSPTPSSQRTAPASTPAPSPSPTKHATPMPSPSPTGLLDETTPSPTPTSTGTAAPDPTVSPSPVLTQGLKHHHHSHHKHLLRRLHRRD